MKKLGYLGPEGTFSHEAAANWGVEGVELVGMTSFKVLVDRLVAGDVEEVILPVENLLFGGVGQCIDAIIATDGQLKIRGEMVLDINLNLIATRTMPLNQITKVISIGEAIGQCTGWIATNIPNASIEYVGSSAVAIRDLEKNGDKAVAVGSAFGARLYGRTVLERNIQDVSDNVTHFIILGRSEIRRSRSKRYKTSIIFSVLDRPGALLKVLNVFDALDINMVKIESRPSKNKLNDYIFWVDIEGHYYDGNVKEALAVIAKNKTAFFRNLGSYPRF
ncbi:MAG: prephenate dehydratase domain-containing protein [Parcubacteria group bacterium]|jgi:prephenate dehydratase